MRSRVSCPECRKVIAWPIDNPAGPFCPECGGLISVVDNKPTERAPMLSDMAMASVRDTWCDNGQTHPLKRSMSPLEVRDFYEAKITSEELRVVKKAKEVWAGNGHYKGCSGCGFHFPMKANFCPGCGAQIVKE